MGKKSNTVLARIHIRRMTLVQTFETKDSAIVVFVDGKP